MNRFLKFFLGLIAIFIIAIALMKNSLHKKDDKKNGFDRNFQKNSVQLLTEKELDSKTYYFSKFTSDSILLNDIRLPYKFLKLSSDFSDSKSYDFHNIFKKLDLSAINYASINDDGVFVSDGRHATGYKIINGNHELLQSRLDTIPFRKMEVINKDSYVLISKDKKNDTLIRLLKKVNWQGKELKRFQPQKPNENIFTVDGFYKFSSKSNRVVYLYAYRGQFTVLDTNLNVMYSSATIDTVRSSGVKIKKVPMTVRGKSITTLTHAAPPKVVNRNLAISDNKIYIQSFLKADNEDLDKHSEMYVIDVYNLFNGRYEYSFYIPRREKQKMLHYEVDRDKFFAIYNNTIVVYRI